jgi:hypothetical protein
MELAQNGREQSLVALLSNDRITLALIAMGIIFASLSLNETIYHFAFLDFDGATDRLPIEMFFGLGFAWMITKLVRKFHQHRKETSERIRFIRDRNYKIRHAVEAIRLVPFPTNHQTIHIIRKKVNQIK